ncbi:hypothetical protein Tco_1407213 [Tanacetum coccineum]
MKLKERMLKEQSRNNAIYWPPGSSNPGNEDTHVTPNSGKSPDGPTTKARYTYGDTVTIKRPRDGAYDDQEPSTRTDRGSKRRRSGKEPASTSAPSETTTTTAGKTTTTGSKTHKQSASQSGFGKGNYQTNNVFEAPAHQECETVSMDEQAEEEEVYKATTEKLDWINPDGRQYPHDLRQPLPLVPNSQGRHVIPFQHFINYDLDTYMVAVMLRFNATAGNPVKKILLKLNLSDHRLCKMVVECQSVKVKEFQERCNIKAFQEWYEHVGPEVASPQGGKVTRWRRDCAWLMISRCSRSLCQIQVQGTSSIQEVNDHYNIFTRESQEYELKTKDKA